jgi:hypothetical protein
MKSCKVLWNRIINIQNPRPRTKQLARFISATIVIKPFPPVLGFLDIGVLITQVENHSNVNSVIKYYQGKKDSTITNYSKVNNVTMHSQITLLPIHEKDNSNVTNVTAL